MLRQVRNVVNFLFVYLVFLIGFSSAFNLLIGNENQSFRSWGISLWVSENFRRFNSWQDHYFQGLSRWRWLGFNSRHKPVNNWKSLDLLWSWLALALMVVHAVIAIILLLNLLIAMLNQSYRYASCRVTTHSISDVIVEATVEHMCERANIILSYGATMRKDTKKMSDLYVS